MRLSNKIVNYLFLMKYYLVITVIILFYSYNYGGFLKPSKPEDENKSCIVGNYYFYIPGSSSHYKPYDITEDPGYPYVVYFYFSKKGGEGRIERETVSVINDENLHHFDVKGKKMIFRDENSKDNWYSHGDYKDDVDIIKSCKEVHEELKRNKFKDLKNKGKRSLPETLTVKEEVKKPAFIIKAEKSLNKIKKDIPQNYNSITKGILPHTNTGTSTLSQYSNEQVNNLNSFNPTGLPGAPPSPTTFTASSTTPSVFWSSSSHINKVKT